MLHWVLSFLGVALLAGFAAFFDGPLMPVFLAIVLICLVCAFFAMLMDWMGRGRDGLYSRGRAFTFAGLVAVAALAGYQWMAGALTL